VLPISVVYLLKVRDDRNFFLPGCRLGVARSVIDPLLSDVPLAAIAILPVESLQFADCESAKPAVAIAAFALKPSTT